MLHLLANLKLLQNKHLLKKIEVFKTTTTKKITILLDLQFPKGGSGSASPSGKLVRNASVTISDEYVTGLVTETLPDSENKGQD